MSNPRKTIVGNLIKIANRLDSKGLYEESNLLDVVIEKIASSLGSSEVKIPVGTPGYIDIPGDKKYAYKIERPGTYTPYRRSDGVKLRTMNDPEGVQKIENAASGFTWEKEEGEIAGVGSSDSGSGVTSSPEASPMSLREHQLSSAGDNPVGYMQAGHLSSTNQRIPTSG